MEEGQTSKTPRRTCKIPRKYALYAALFFIAAVAAISFFSEQVPAVESVKVGQSAPGSDVATVTVTVERQMLAAADEEYLCYLGPIEDAAFIPRAGWVSTSNRQARFEVPTGNYYVFAKDRYGVVSRVGNGDTIVNDVLGVTLNYERLVLPLNDQRLFEAQMLVLGQADTAVTWSTTDEKVATISDGLLRTAAPGTVTITATASNGKKATAEVVVTDLFHTPVLDEGKLKLPIDCYTEEQARLLDEALAGRIREAGYATRAGAVAAARFLTLEFEYYISYFYENGRLVNHHNRYVDGEGRYYHVGLYLTDSKYADLSASFAGPAHWGALLTNYEDEGFFSPGVRYPNGLDCSGFVTWVLLNGGFDVGDVGAGEYLFRDDDLCDLGEQVPLSVDLLRSGRVRVGDLIGMDGHIAIIAGLTEDHIYIAESLGKGVRISSYTLEDCVYRAGIYTYVMLMDSVYLQDGNLTPMWT